MGLYCGYGFPGWISKDKDDNVIEFTGTDIDLTLIKLEF